HLELFEFSFSNPLLLNLANNGVEHSESRFTGDFGLVKDTRGHLGGAVVTKDVVDSALCLHRQLLFEHQLAVHPARTSAMQGLIEQSHGAPVGSPPLGNDIAYGHRRQSTEFLDDFAAPLFGLLWLGGIREPGRRPGRYIRKVFFSERKTV